MEGGFFLIQEGDLELFGHHNKFIEIISEQMLGSGHKLSIPKEWMNDPFSGGTMNLPAVGIMVFITTILVIGIRQSSFFNTLMVGIKLAVVLFVIVIGISYVAPANWTTVPTTDRQLPGEKQVKDEVGVRAYQIWQARGSPVQAAAESAKDWHQAEKLLLEERQRSKAADLAAGDRP